MGRTGVGQRAVSCMSFAMIGVVGVVGGLGGGVTNDGAARSLARADFAASICAFKLGFAINS